ncbi:ABC transporter substrate-binding protein [Ensifer adhaerens]|jgi:branched-chain amino acid transport system substrate-binding protein|uniref:ABC transporter substrate-binding protein n=1 Tax=Ensifer adhaerens TaxID=106592 RepID=UPI00202E2AEB|nr:ABC transporter substrate-binding protein [Ensifer adhaerens]
MGNTSRKFARHALWHATASTLVLGLATAASAATIKIGLLAPLTGSASADGQEFKRGTELAVEEINAVGGINGDTFEVVVADVKDQSAGSVTSAVERLLGDPDVHFILTGYASLTNFEIDLMAEAEMPYMLAGSSQATLEIIAADPAKYDCCWSFTPSYDAYNTGVSSFVEGLIDEKAMTAKSKSVAVISSDNSYSKTIAEGMKANFSSKGWKVVVDETVPFGEVNDWSGVLAQIRTSSPDVVINTDYQTANAASFLNQFLEGPTDSLLFLQYAPSVQEFTELAGAKSNGVIYNMLVGSVTSPKNPRAEEVSQKFKKKYGADSGAYGATLYEMTNIYFDAVRQAGSVDDHAAIMKALGATDKKTSSGRIKFDPATHLATQGDDFIPLTFYQIWDGNRHLIAPNTYAVDKFRPQPWMK